MRRGVCLKCRSTDLYLLPVKAAGAYQDLWLGGQTIFSERGSHFIVCHACGYAERYVNSEALSKLPKYGTPLNR